MANEVIYKNVKRKVFDEVSDLCEYGKEVCNPFFTNVTVYYNGTNLEGDMRIEVKSGETSIYKIMLQKVAEILSKY